MNMHYMHMLNNKRYLWPVTVQLDLEMNATLLPLDSNNVITTVCKQMKTPRKTQTVVADLINYRRINK